MSAVGHYAPPGLLTNQDLEKVLDTSDEWIASRTGMKRRHIAAPDQATSDLCIAAAKNALGKTTLKPSDIDCFIVATATPDYPFPATACIVASSLGATDKPAFDVEIACSGFIYGLTLASGLIISGVYSRVMLIGAETLSKIVDRSDRSTAVLFGDGAGAVILEASEQNSFLSSDLGSDGSRPEMLCLLGGGSRRPFTVESLEAGEQYLRMEGREVFKFAVTKMIHSTGVALKKAHLHKGDVDWLIPHQANRRIIDAAAKYLDMPEDKVIINIEEYGNTSAASIPIALSEALDSGKIKPGDVIVFVGFGGGLSWGAVTWRWA
ncbi:MAG TPA: beta-ketoacyl-ACP synthase III [Candidatus Rubrimentiphilum sp.]|nr:beta-ketoacyl-ACP synthase III [Candidatus Rubrimentiphilum sp.]